MDPGAMLRSRRFVILLVLAAVLGAVISLVGWCFLVLVNHLQDWVFDDLPDGLGFDGAPAWWPLPCLALSGLLTAAAITRLPGNGGHVPADGLNPGGVRGIDLPGVVLAALASLGLGAVLGPEAPLIAIGGGLAAGLMALRKAPDDVTTLIAAVGSFAAISLLFGSPLIAAVLILEIAGLGRPRAVMLLLPGLLAAGVGSLVYIGLGSWAGLSTSDYSIDPLALPDFARPSIGDFLWTIPLAAAVAIGAAAIFAGGRWLHGVVVRRPYVLTVLAGLAVAGLAIGFDQITDRGIDEVLFSGQESLPPLVSDAGSWSIGALFAVIAFKGLAYSISLASFRGGPVFPALFLGGAAGILASHLPGLDLTPAVAVGLGAATAATLRLPLTAVLLAVILTASSGAGATPVIIVGVVVAYIIAYVLHPDPAPRPAPPPAPAADPARAPAGP
jgi:H+/Cl- antiporter ClcA